MNYFNNDIRELFINHYVIYVYLSCLGTLQVVSAISNLRGIMLLSNRKINVVLGCFFIVAGFIFFFVSPLFLSSQWVGSEVQKATLQNFASLRNVNDIDGGLHGTAQFLLFFLCCILSFLTSITLSAILMITDKNLSKFEKNDKKYKGIFRMKRKNYFSSLRINIKNRNFDEH
ncbi:MAG: hypothetical protein CL748_00690 [Chloroflexi bacterium]|nr:hypothetical protein [Chloroflexota bacterium]